MAFKHGKNAALWLGSVDVSQYFGDMVTTVAIESAETTTFTATYKTYVEGQASAKIAAKGFYDYNIDAQLAATLRNSGSVVTALPGGAAAIGDLARLILADSVALEESSPVGGAVMMAFDVTTTGIIGWGYALHPWATDTNTTTGATRDDAAATTTGWRAHLHVSAVTAGSWVVKIQDASASNFSDGADVTGGAFTAATGATSQRLVSASGATLRRYVRYVATRTGGSASDSITFGLALARN